MGLGSFVKKAAGFANPVKAVKNVYNAVTGKDAKKAAASANAAYQAQADALKKQQTQTAQYDRKMRGDLGADASSLPGLGFEAPPASSYTDLTGLGGTASDKKLSKRKALGD